jgi:HAD superfamily hydrolase (TIGR01509 family)
MIDRMAPLRIDAVVFDFDGLILDTEMPSFVSWREVFEHFGCELTEEEHVSTLGSNFDRIELLRGRVTSPLPPDDEVRALKFRRHQELLADIEPLPGVMSWLDEADALGISLGIASSSPPDWVHDLLDRFDLRRRFAAVICCGDDLPRKPEPDAYLAACTALGVHPSTAVAVEDSANGVAAAKAAGLLCVAVPNELTRGLDLSAADVRLTSLADESLADVCARFG